MTKPEDMLTILEAAKYLRCGRSTVINRLKDGSFPSIKPGKERLIDPVDLDKYLAKIKQNILI